MSQGSRPSRVGDQLRAEIADLLSRDVHDPGIGFVTITRVDVTPDQYPYAASSTRERSRSGWRTPKVWPKYVPYESP